LKQLILLEIVQRVLARFQRTQSTLRVFLHPRRERLTDRRESPGIERPKYFESNEPKRRQKKRQKREN